MPPWPSAPYRYLVVDQDLRAVLEEFGHNTGTRIVLSDGVKGRVRGSLPQGPAQEFLDTLARSYGLDWYFDGALLHVSAASEAGTRMVALHGTPFAQFAASLDKAAITDPRFTLREGTASDLAMVSGPPRYIQLVEQAAAAIAVPKPAVAAAQAPLQVRVFQGAATPQVHSFPVGAGAR